MSGFTLFTSNTERFRTIRRTLAFYARGKDEERAQVLLDDIQVEIERLQGVLEQIAGIDRVKYVEAPLLEVQRIARDALRSGQ